MKEEWEKEAEEEKRWPEIINPVQPSRAGKNFAEFRPVGWDLETYCLAHRPVLGSPNERWSSGHLSFILDMHACQAPLTLLPDSSIAPIGCKLIPYANCFTVVM